MGLKSLLVGAKSSLIGAGLCLTLSSCSLPAVTPTKPLPAVPVVSKEEKKHLFVNISMDHYQLKKSSEEGDKDLVRLARLEKLEESFLCAEYIDETIWQENGELEMSYGVTSRFDLALPLINHRLQQLSFNHFHTLFEEKYDGSQVPSMADFITCNDFMRNINDFCPAYADKVSCRVAVSTGVYTIKLDPILIDDGFAEQEFFNTLWDMEIEMRNCFSGKSKEFDYSVGNMVDFVKLNHKFARRYSTDLIKIDFKEIN